MRALVVSIALLPLACGDALVSGEYRGEPIFKLEGQITTISVLPETLRDAELSISLFCVLRQTKASARRHAR